MKKSLVFVVALLGVSLGLGFSVGLVAQEGVQVYQHMKYSHREQEQYRLSLGVTTQGKALKPEPMYEERDVFKVPDYYGNLLEVTPIGADVVFWYEDQQGVIRNAVIEGPAARGVTIMRQTAHKLSVSAVRNSSNR